MSSPHLKLNRERRIGRLKVYLAESISTDQQVVPLDRMAWRQKSDLGLQVGIPATPLASRWQGEAHYRVFVFFKL